MCTKKFTNLVHTGNLNFWRHALCSLLIMFLSCFCSELSGLAYRLPVASLPALCFSLLCQTKTIATLVKNFHPGAPTSSHLCHGNPATAARLILSPTG